MMAKQPKLTKWFDGSKFVPYHIGWYISCMSKATDTMRFWDGAKWNYRDDRNISGMRYCAFQNRPWRGLAEQPKEGV